MTPSLTKQRLAEGGPGPGVGQEMAFYGDGEPRVPGAGMGGGPGPPPEPHRAATRPGGCSVTSQPESFLGPAGPSSKAVAGLQWGWERALLPPVRIHSPYPASCPVLGAPHRLYVWEGPGWTAHPGHCEVWLGPCTGKAGFGPELSSAGLPLWAARIGTGVEVWPAQHPCHGPLDLPRL